MNILTTLAACKSTQTSITVPLSIQCELKGRCKVPKVLAG